MNEIEKAIKTISDIYSEYLSSETDTVNLSPYDEPLQEVHTVLEQALQAQSERDRMRCGNCKNIRFNDNCHWCGCSNGLDGDRKITDYCSYFETKENENE